MAPSERHVTFVLRLWHQQDMQAGQWRSEVTHVQTGVMVRFGDLSSLFTHLRSLLEKLEVEVPEERDVGLQ